MKAIICPKYGPPEVLELKEVLDPVPQKNEVCIKIYATAVTASDCIIRGFNVSFKYKLPMGLALGFKKPRQPVLGIVFAGKVESTGPNVISFKKDDQVFGWDLFPDFGAWAQYKCISENKLLTKKPANLTYKEAASIPYGGLLALHFLKKGEIQNRQKVLIYGASGAIGTSAVQLAKYFGAEVTGVCSTVNLEFVKSLGADKVIDYTKDNIRSNKEMYDLIFDAVGKKKKSFLKFQCKKMLNTNGKYISVDDGTPKLLLNDLILLKALVETGNLKPVIDKTYNLEQIVQANTYVDKGHKRGNVIITVKHDNDNIYESEKDHNFVHC